MEKGARHTSAKGLTEKSNLRRQVKTYSARSDQVHVIAEGGENALVFKISSSLGRKMSKVTDRSVYGFITLLLIIIGKKLTAACDKYINSPFKVVNVFAFYFGFIENVLMC